MKSKVPLNAIVDIIIKVVGETGDMDEINEAVNVAERLYVSLICMFVVHVAKEHEDHDNCETIKGLPQYVDLCRKDFNSALTHHLELNCLVNDVKLYQTETINEKTKQEILDEMAKATEGMD